MESKETKFQISLEAVRKIVRRIKEGALKEMSAEELAVTAIVPGFSEICKGLGVEWSSANEKEVLERIKAAKIEIPWLNTKASPQYGPFLVHCSRGDIGKVKEFIRKVPKEQKQEMLRATDSLKRTGLHLAAKQGYDVLVQFLLNQGWSVSSRDRELKTPLHHACQSSAEVTANILLSHKAVPASRDIKQQRMLRRGNTPLHTAVCGTSSKIVSQLLQAERRLSDCKNYEGQTPLHLAVLNSAQNQIDILRMLFESGAAVDAIDDYGRTALHYASQAGKSRCLPILIKNKANIFLKDSHKKTAVDLASNERIKKIFEAYANVKAPLKAEEEQQISQEYHEKLKNQSKINNMKKPKKSNDSKVQQHTSNNPLLGGQINQIATWLRQKFFVMMKKLQQSGVKSRIHLKRPYIFTGSWMEDITDINDLYSVLADVPGAEAAMRVFNILCPYEKKLPTGLSINQVVQSFFGEQWYGNQPLELARKMKGQEKLRRELEDKEQFIKQLQAELATNSEQVTKLENEILATNDELKKYKKIEEQVRKQRVKSAQQYSQILKLTNQNEQLKKQVAEAYSGDDEVEKLNTKLKQIKQKNEQLVLQVESLKSYEAAARRKCGKLFLKALQMKNQPIDVETQNMYDDDSIVRLYELLQGNPPNLMKRMQAVDRNGDGKLTAQQFTTFLERLKMLPQDILSMNRLVGFVSGRKHISFEEFTKMLQERPQLRNQWEKKLVRKVVAIVQSQFGSVEKLFQQLDTDKNENVSVEQLRSGLENFNIFINQKDMSNLFSLLDADKSGNVSLQEFKALLKGTGTHKVIPLMSQKQLGSNSQKDVDSRSRLSKQKITPMESNRDENQDHEQDQDGNETHREEQPQENNQQNGNQDNNQQNEEEEPANQQPNNQQPVAQAGDKPQQDPIQPDRRAAIRSAAYSSEHIEEDQDAEGQRVSGIFKIQARFCQNILEQETLEKVALQFLFGREEIIKVGDLNKKKWEIAVKFNVVNKLKSTIDVIKVILWKNRDFQEENYLGECQLSCQKLMENPDEWAINESLDLVAREYEKEVTGCIGLQARWKPQQS